MAKATNSSSRLESLMLSGSGGRRMPNGRGSGMVLRGMGSSLIAADDNPRVVILLQRKGGCEDRSLACPLRVPPSLHVRKLPR